MLQHALKNHLDPQSKDGCGAEVFGSMFKTNHIAPHNITDAAMKSLASNILSSHLDVMQHYPGNSNSNTKTAGFITS